MRSSFVRTLTRPRPERLGGRARGSSSGWCRVKVASFKGKGRSAAARQRSSSRADANATVARDTLDDGFLWVRGLLKNDTCGFRLRVPPAARTTTRAALNIVKALVALIFPAVVFFAFGHVDPGIVGGTSRSERQPNGRQAA